MMKEQKKEFTLLHPPAEKFTEFIEDGTMERVVDMRLDNLDVSLLKFIYP